MDSATVNGQERTVISDPKAHSAHFRSASQKFRMLEDEQLARRLGSEEWDAKKVYNLKRHHTLREGYLAAKAQHDLEMKQFHRRKSELEAMESNDRSFVAKLQFIENERVRLEKQQQELADREEVIRLQEEEDDVERQMREQFAADLQLAQKLSAVVDVMPEGTDTSMDAELAQKLSATIDVMPEKQAPAPAVDKDLLLAQELDRQLNAAPSTDDSAHKDMLLAQELDKQLNKKERQQPASSAGSGANEIMPAPEPTAAAAAAQEQPSDSDEDEASYGFGFADMPTRPVPDRQSSRQRLMDEQRLALEQIEMERQDAELARKLQLDALAHRKKEAELEEMSRQQPQQQQMASPHRVRKAPPADQMQSEQGLVYL